jgi:hypothetical protein
MAHEEDLDTRPGIRNTLKPRWKNFRIVEYEEIVIAKMLWELAEFFVLYRSRVSINGKHARGLSAPGGLLSDQFFW